MRRSFAAVTVGLVTLAALAAGYTVFKYTRERVTAGEGYVVYALFKDALGIYTKSRVLSAGIEVGQIEDKRLDPQTNLARVDIRIFPHIKVYENAVVSKRAASLLGEFYLDIDPGTPAEMRDGQRVVHRELKEGDRIVHVLEPTAMGEIIDQVGATLPILKDILRDVRQLTSGSVKEIADNVNQMIQKNSVVLDRLLQRVDNIAADIEDVTSEKADDIKVTIQNAREISESIKNLVGTSEGQVTQTGEELRGSIQKLQRSIDSFEKSLKNLEKITGKVAQGEGTVGRLVNDDRIAENIENITEDASTFVRGVARLQTIVGLRTEYNYLANTFKTYFMVQLAPRPDKFYLLEVVDDPRGFREATTIVGQSSDRGSFSETTVKTSEKLRISFQFGKRIGPFTGRFGIKESTGGIGMDLHLLGDRLMLSTDIFDTRSNQYPRVTGRATLAVYKRYVHIIAGVDDVLNFQRTQGAAGGFFDWFFGAQLVFNDEDLKNLLLFGGSGMAGAASK